MQRLVLPLVLSIIPNYCHFLFLTPYPICTFPILSTAGYFIHLVRLEMRPTSSCTRDECSQRNGYRLNHNLSAECWGYIAHAENAQNSYMQFGEKGVENSYYCYSTIRFSMSSSAEISVASSIIHHSQSLPFAFSNPPSNLHFSHTFNSRTFHSLSLLRDVTNKLMHTRHMFQKNGYRLNHYLSAECWGYLCLRLEGKCCIMDGEVERVRRLFLSDLAQERKNFHRQRVTTITIECQEELVSLRNIFCSSFCAGARCHYAAPSDLRSSVVEGGLEKANGKDWE